MHTPIPTEPDLAEPRSRANPPHSRTPPPPFRSVPHRGGDGQGVPGLTLVDEFAGARRKPGIVLLGDASHPVTPGAAARAGLLDVFESTEADATLQQRLAAAVREVQLAGRRRASREKARRRSRSLARRCTALESRCAKVENERKTISDQVETLCSDLVGAYQDLSDRLDAATTHGTLPAAGVRPRPDLEAKLDGELGLEPVLRTTLEHLVGITGPCNAAIFLPSSMDEYSLGGYVNHTCTTESAGMLLEHLADVVAPKLAGTSAPVHLTDNSQLAAWFDDDAAWLDDSELLGIPCTLGENAAEGEAAECLAVVVLFRDGDQPFGAAALEACESLGPVLAETLHRVIRVHHRTGFGGAEDGDLDDDFS